MLIKKIIAKQVKDSRKEKTIKIIIKTSKGKFVSSAPSGKSKGKFEVKSYAKNLAEDISFINKLDINKLNLEKFEDLNKIEILVRGKIGGNSLFALESSLLKALAKEQNKELWEIAGLLDKPNKASDIAKSKLKIRPVGNAIGGGLHSKGVGSKRPDFQEFLFIGNGKSFKEGVRINNLAYKLCKKFLKARKRNDEGAWETNLDNEEVLIIMDRVRSLLKEKGFEIDIGLDVAASSFYKDGKYVYKNKEKIFNKNMQIEFLKELINRYKILYIEDALDEEDFSGFRELKARCKNSLIVGDDLIVTNPSRLMKAIRLRSVNAIILKPNQIGSLITFKKVVDICKKYKIKTIISHRSGETKDDTISDLAIGFECDFIKTGIYGIVRKSKLKRLIKIEKINKK